MSERIALYVLTHELCHVRVFRIIGLSCEIQHGGSRFKFESRAQHVTAEGREASSVCQADALIRIRKNQRIQGQIWYHRKDEREFVIPLRRVRGLASFPFRMEDLARLQDGLVTLDFRLNTTRRSRGIVLSLASTHKTGDMVQANLEFATGPEPAE